MEHRDEFDQATARAERRRTTGPTAVTAHFDRGIGRVVISLSTGLDIMFSPHDVQGLETTKPDDLDAIEISPSGFGLHFPKIDADLYLPALLDGFLGSERWMAAARLGERGGRTRTNAKATASRANGRLGGRPRKTTPA